MYSSTQSSSKAKCFRCRSYFQTQLSLMLKQAEKLWFTDVRTSPGAIKPTRHKMAPLTGQPRSESCARPHARQVCLSNPGFSLILLMTTSLTLPSRNRVSEPDILRQLAGGTTSALLGRTPYLCDAQTLKQQKQSYECVRIP